MPYLIGAQGFAHAQLALGKSRLFGSQYCASFAICTQLLRLNCRESACTQLCFSKASRMRRSLSQLAPHVKALMRTEAGTLGRSVTTVCYLETKTACFQATQAPRFADSFKLRCLCPHRTCYNHKCFLYGAWETAAGGVVVC